MTEHKSAGEKKESPALEVLKDWPRWIIPVLAFGGLCFLIGHLR